MASKLEISTKRFAISKANAQMVAVTAAAAFVSAFCLVTANTLRGESGYQNRVLTAQQKAYNQLQANVSAVSKLDDSYKSFVSKPTNVIGGSSTGIGANDGDNAKIVLDALPSQYDFPALTSSIEKVLTSLNMNVSSISGTDDELAQQSNQGGNTPQPVPMAFSFEVTQATYASVQQLLTTLQASIRPIQIDNLVLSGGSADMTATINGHTYYQPQINLTTTTETIK